MVISLGIYPIFRQTHLLGFGGLSNMFWYDLIKLVPKRPLEKKGLEWFPPEIARKLGFELPEIGV